MNYNTILPPFKWFVLQNFPYIEDDFDALTNWQLFCKLGKEMNKIIEKTNLTGEQVENLTNAFNELKAYVDDYFENLDVQDEINEKLDEMAQSGELQEILESILNNTKSAGVNFNTLNDLINSTTLVEGNYAIVNGFENVNDGFIGKYTVTTTGTENSIYCVKTANNLYCNLINNYSNNYYDEIQYKTYRNEDTDYYITHVPNVDVNGNQIKPYISQRESDLSPLEDAQKNYTTLTTNASLSINVNDHWEEASVIANGEIIHDNDIAGLSDDYDYIAIKGNNLIVSYQANQTTAQEMIADGVVQACLCFGQCVSNGVIKQDFTHQLDKDPDQYIGQTSNLDIYILSTDARNSANAGLDYQQASQILIDKGCVNVWALDGGGSTTTIYKGSKINMNIDEGGTKDRKISYLFNWKKPTVNIDLAKTYNQIGRQKQELNKQLRQVINHKQPLMYYAKLRLGEQQTLTPSTENVLKLRAVSPTNADVIKINTTNANDNYIYFDLDNDEHKEMTRYILYITTTLYVENFSGSKHRVELDLYENNDKELTTRSTIDNNDVTTLNFSELLYVNDDAQIRIKFDPYAGANIFQGVTSIFLIPNADKELPLYDVQSMG